MNSRFKIVPADASHASFIGYAVAEAIGEEICSDFAAPSHSLTDVVNLFASLAAMEDSQYSYRNALVAVDSDSGEVAGVIIGYDGALLHSLRRRFFEQTALQLGKNMEEIPDETDPSEFYLDTLAVLPSYRGKGIGSALLRAAVAKAHAMGKPAGLLVDKTNPSAQRLYEAVGFTRIGERPFASVLMNHMSFPLDKPM